MLDLYLAELRRFRVGAAAFAAAHLAILALVQDRLEITTSPMGVHVMMLCLYLMAGYGYAAVQFGSYRQPSRWIWLLHRPLHRARILAALVLAALTFVVLAVALPQVLVLVAQQHYSYRVIDARHFFGAACFSLAALAGWLSGGWFMLHRSRWAFLVACLPLVLTLYLATATTVLALWLACDGVLLVLLYTVFCPQRNAPADTAATIPGAMMLQVGFYIAMLWSGTVLFYVGLLVPGVQSASYDRESAQVYTDTIRLTVPDRILAGLATSTEPQAGAWRSALPAAGAQAVSPIIRGVAVPNLISTRGLLNFTQGEIKWTFSEDARMYRGVNTRTGASAGWFGAGGRGVTGPFETQPAAQRDNRGGRWMIDSHALYALENGDRQLREVLRVDADEWLASGIAWTGKNGLLLTNRRIILLTSAGPALALKGTLPLPAPFPDLGAVDVARVADGTLVSVLSGYRQFEGGGAAVQRVYLFDDAGAVREVAQRALVHEFPPLFEHRAWWMSPVLFSAVVLPELLIDNGDFPDAHASRLAPLVQPRPPIVWVAAITTMLLAGIGAAWWVRRAPMAPAARLAWCLACLVLGLPAFLALMVVAPGPRFSRRTTLHHLRLETTP